MTYVVVALLAAAAAGLTVVLWRAFRRPDLGVTRAVVEAAERRASAIAEAKEVEAKMRAGLAASVTKLDEAERRGRKSGLGAVLTSLGGKRRK